MKILIPSYDFKPMLGGVANYVHEVASHLTAHHGAAVTVIARSMPGCAEYDARLNYKVERISTWNSAYGSQFGFVPALTKEIPKHDLILCPLWFPDAMSVFWAQKLVRNRKPLYIVVHASELFHIHNSFKTRVRHILISKLQDYVFRSAQGVIAVSSYTGDQVHRQLGYNRDKIHVINNGVNLDAFTRAQPSTLQNRKIFHLLTVTRLHAYKGVDTVLEALALLKSKTEHFSYTVVGAGPDIDRLKGKTTELGLTEKVTFTGPVTATKVIDHYHAADLFVMMSRYDHPDVEGFGLVFLEAAACGVASIGGNSGGIPDAIENGKTGWLCEPQDAKTLCDLIYARMQDRPQLEKISQHAWESAQHRTWKKNVEQLWRVLNETK